MSTGPVLPDPSEPVQTPFADAASPFKRTEVPEHVSLEPVTATLRPVQQQSAWVTYRAQINFGLAILAYLMVLVGAITVVEANPSSPWRVYIAFLPVVPGVLGLFIFVRSLMRLEELQARIQLYAVGLTLGATALITFGYGFFEGAGLPHLAPTYVLPLMVILWGLGTAFFAWRYRS